MMLRVDHLVKRGGIYIYRRVVPPKLRAILGKREWKESLATSDLNEAQVRWRAVHERVEAMFSEAEAGRRSPSIAAYNGVLPILLLTARSLV